MPHGNQILDRKIRKKKKSFDLIVPIGLQNIEILSLRICMLCVILWKETTIWHNA